MAEETYDYKRGRRAALHEAVGVAEATARDELSARDRLLREDNPEGALTRARQSQTASEIAKAIRKLALATPT